MMMRPSAAARWRIKGRRHRKSLSVLLVSLIGRVLMNIPLAPLFRQIVIFLMILFINGSVIWDMIATGAFGTAPGGGNGGNVAGHGGLPCNVGHDTTTDLHGYAVPSDSPQKAIFTENSAGPGNCRSALPPHELGEQRHAEIQIAMVGAENHTFAMMLARAGPKEF